MGDASFVTFAVPAENTKVGGLTKQVPGCVVDLVGQPIIRDQGHAYLLHYFVRGLPPQAKDAMVAEMGSVYEAFEELAWDPEGGLWEVRGVVPVGNIRSSGLRFVAGLFGLVDAPWVCFKDGLAHVRLHARIPAALPGLVEQVDAKREKFGLTAPPAIERLDGSEYQARIEALQQRKLVEQ